MRSLKTQHGDGNIPLHKHTRPTEVAVLLPHMA